MALRGTNPGRFDQKLTLKQPAKTVDGTTNAVIKTYTTAGTVRAERMFQNSGERFEAQQQVGASVEKFRFRDYRSLYTITQEWVFVWENEGKTFHVLGIEKEGRKNFVILTGEYRDN